MRMRACYPTRDGSRAACRRPELDAEAAFAGMKASGAPLLWRALNGGGVWRGPDMVDPQRFENGAREPTLLVRLAFWRIAPEGGVFFAPLEKKREIPSANWIVKPTA